MPVEFCIQNLKPMYFIAWRLEQNSNQNLQLTKRKELVSKFMKRNKALLL